MPTKLKLCRARGSQTGTHETRAAIVWGYADVDFEAEKELLEPIDWESLIVDDIDMSSRWCYPMVLSHVHSNRGWLKQPSCFQCNCFHYSTCNIPIQYIT